MAAMMRVNIVGMGSPLPAADKMSTGHKKDRPDDSGRPCDGLNQVGGC
jgi:hypothetical protein